MEGITGIHAVSVGVDDPDAAEGGLDGGSEVQVHGLRGDGQDRLVSGVAPLELGMRERGAGHPRNAKGGEYGADGEPSGGHVLAMCAGKVARMTVPFPRRVCTSMVPPTSCTMSSSSCSPR